MNDEDALSAAMAEWVRRNAAMVEQACEAALQGGIHGVRVTRYFDGSVAARVDPEVPYGEVHEYLR